MFTGNTWIDILSYGKEGYLVSKEDKQKLFDFGNRSGFTDGYYLRHNGKEMITFDRPGHTKGGEKLQEQIRKTYIETDKKEAISGKLVLKKKHPACLTAGTKEHTVTVSGEIVQQAVKRPMSEETVREKIKKTGNTPYQFDELEITMDPDIFLPVVALNQLRREALEQLMAAETAKDRREAPAPVSYQTFTEGVREEAAEYESGNAPYLAVSVEQKQALEAALHTDFIRRIYLGRRNAVSAGRRESIAACGKTDQGCRERGILCISDDLPETHERTVCRKLGNDTKCRSRWIFDQKL